MTKERVDSGKPWWKKARALSVVNAVLILLQQV